MKRILSLVLVLALAISAFVGCNNDDVPTEKDYNLSIGVVNSVSLDDAEVTQTVAAIVTDADGKIVLCRLDCIVYSAFDRNGAIVTTAPASKVAQGDAYDAYMPMPAGRWYQQADALATYVTGKTQADVKALGADGYVKDVVASCTIHAGDLLKAIDNAFESEHKVAFKSAATAFTAGVSAIASVEAEESTVTFAVEYAAAVLADGAVVAAILDTAEDTLKGVTTADAGLTSVDYKGTKREQGDAYDAWSPMAAGRWYQQADAYCKAAVGLTKDNIATLASAGVAGCTIYSGGYKAGIAAAVKAAK